ncbi:phosphatase PAP2 family protein [Companilactobacillus alimentarius]|uniref:Phosphatidic acid phosphatase type 2/haloperoxidase domain-containing protein n=1 Tax=Companilactobacillus alimentarius DSM 20249 TaxID=1423720 RepID=A0A2K9HG47_9LACO|nr:phosphatase PAP2 family protein [Companilactobacillus alimentarius]AUI71521.1 hypothetical protein LA20249_04640 [Companilactobacillus alimentarius DSM 20249]MDT6953502.1 phosphatase PAP2 family protein [Companilactobacillus alimentarius]
MKISKKLIITNVLLVLFFVFWTINITQKTTLITNFDNFFIDQIYHHNNFSLNIFRPITNLGDTLPTILIAAAFFVLLIIKKYYYAAIFLVLNKVVVALLNSLIKNIIERPRPSHYHYVYAGGFSFPSGHSASSFALYISLLIIAWFIFKNIKFKLLISILTISIVILVGYSRIFLGVHYPSDVLGGYTLAAIILTFNSLLFGAKNFSILQLKGIKN